MSHATLFLSLLFLLLQSCQTGKTRGEQPPALDAGRIEDGMPVLTANIAEASALFREAFGAREVDNMQLLQEGEGIDVAYYLYAEGVSAERGPDGTYADVIMRFRAVRDDAVITLPPLSALSGESCNSRGCEECAFLPQGGCDCTQGEGDGAQVNCNHTLINGLTRLMN